MSKREQYLAGLSHCVSSAQTAASDEVYHLWSHVADSYRTLLEFEDRHPTKPDGGGDGSAKP